MEHLKLLTSFLILFAASWVLLHTWQTFRRHRRSYLKSLLAVNLLLFALFLVMNLIKYSDVNIGPDFLPRHVPYFRYLAVFFFLPLFAALLFFIQKTAWELLETPMPRWLALPCVGLAPAVVLVYAVALLAGRAERWRGGLDFLVERAGDLLFLVQFAVLILLYVRSRRLGDRLRARMNKGFTLVFVSPYPAALGFALLFRVLERFPFWALLGKRLLMLWVAALPFVWLRLCFRPYAGSLGQLVDRTCDMDEICRRHHVSAREREVLQLLLDGRSNKEIEQQLFISYHTVKNHIYNLFRKFEVSTRHQLVHKLTRHLQDGG